MASATVETVLTAVRAAGREGATTADLAESLGIAKATVTRSVTKLESEDLVRRRGSLVTPVLRRGRRLIQTEERDERVLRMIRDAGSAGQTLIALARELGISRDLTYQSVWRLRSTGQVRRESATRTARWIAVDDQASAEVA
jgi:DNA-binding IclR family transcriptional regulator